MRAWLPLFTLLLATYVSSSLAQQDPDVAVPSFPPSDSINAPEPACESAEECFRAAFILTGPLQDRMRVKVERLHRAQALEPASRWSKRAALLEGLTLTPSAPSETIRLLESVQQDFPHLDDYIRFWTGEAQAKLGEFEQAATLFESIVESPDSILMARASYRAGDLWYRAEQCGKAIDQLNRGLALSPLDSFAPTAEFQIADCHQREQRVAESQAAFRHLWVRYPNSPEARQGADRLTLLSGGQWVPSPDELYNRALAFSSLALHAEAVDHLRKFLSMAPHHAKRDEAKFKLGTALTRLKRYDEARDVFRALVDGSSVQAGEASVWLGRVYLRQDAGDRLLSLLPSVSSKSLTGDQKAMILLLAGIWLDDQGQYDKAVLKYRQASQTAEGNSQRFEALWRVGWIYYRTGQYESAIASFQKIAAGPDDPQWTPQALYWIGRSRERLQDREAVSSYTQVCRRYYFTYYCQLARSKLPASGMAFVTGSASSSQLMNLDAVEDLKKDRHYVKAVELKLLRLDQEAAKELASLPERYAKDRTVITELCGLLTEVGEHHQALRLTRLYFREPIERGGTPVPDRLWAAAYPTAYLPLIRTYAGSVDPFLAAAIIREESQYEIRALSRAGAVGLMQVMPATAQNMAKKNGGGDIGRDELFDYETNIKFGVQYLDQLLEQFSGNVTQAVASYNAGPQAVVSWIDKYAGKEGDEFVEMIPYQETRHYVKRVLRSYREYQRLAGVHCAVGSLDKVC